MNIQKIFTLILVSAITAAPSLRLVAQTGAAPILPPFRVEESASALGGDEATSSQSLTNDGLFISGANDLSALDGPVANFTINDGSANSFGDVYGIRGIVNTPFFGDPAVAVYIDDMPTGQALAFPTELLDVASVEVLRGPHGTSFGKNSQAGVVLINTIKPGDETAGMLQGSYGSYDAYSARASVRTPIGDKGIYFGLSGLYSERSGYYDNITLGTEPDYKSTVAGRIFLRAEISEAFSLTWQTVMEDHKDGTQPYQPLTNKPYEIAMSFDGVTEVTNYLHSLKADLDTGTGVRLLSVTSYGDYSLDPYTTENVIGGGFALASRIFQNQTQFSEEIRAESSDPDAALQWRGGLYYEDRNSDGDNLRSAFFGPVEISRFNLDSETWALFGNGSYAINPKTRFSAGLRYEDVSKDFQRAETVPAVKAASLDNDFDAVLPTFGLTHDLAQNVTAYARISRGWKPGGFSAYTGDPTLMPFEEETMWAYEAGIKTRSANPRMWADFSVFFYDIENYQVERSVPTGGGASEYLVFNAEEAESYGFEADFVWQPLDSLRLRAVFGYTHVEFENYVGAISGTDFSGNRAPFTPEFDLSLSAEWRSPTGFLVWGEYRATGETFYEESNSATFSENGYGLFNFRVGYETETAGIYLFGENVTDEEYFTTINAGIAHGVYGTPRIFGVEGRLFF